MDRKDYGYKSVGVLNDVFEEIHILADKENKKLYSFATDLIKIGMKVYRERQEKIKLMETEDGR